MNLSDTAKARVIIVDGTLIFEKEECSEIKLEKCISQKVKVYIAKTVNNFPYIYAQLTSTYESIKFTNE